MASGFEHFEVLLSLEQVEQSAVIGRRLAHVLSWTSLGRMFQRFGKCCLLFSTAKKPYLPALFSKMRLLFERKLDFIKKTTAIFNNHNIKIRQLI